MSYLAIVRHGESQANADGIIAGIFETPITEKGRLQARQAASLLRDIPFQAAYASTLMRTQQTLREMLDELNLDIKPVYSEELRERNWGRLEGKYGDNRNNEFTEEEAKQWKTWDVGPPEGESYADLSKRMVGYFDSHILPWLKQGENVLLVSHNGILKTIQRHLENVPREHIHSLMLKNAEAKVYEFDESGRVVSVEVRSIHQS